MGTSACRWRHGRKSLAKSTRSSKTHRRGGEPHARGRPALALLLTNPGAKTMERDAERIAAAHRAMLHVNALDRRRQTRHWSPQCESELAKAEAVISSTPGRLLLEVMRRLRSGGPQAVDPLVAPVVTTKERSQRPGTARTVCTPTPACARAGPDSSRLFEGPRPAWSPRQQVQPSALTRTAAPSPFIRSTFGEPVCRHRAHRRRLCGRQLLRSSWRAVRRKMVGDCCGAPVQQQEPRSDEGPSTLQEQLPRAPGTPRTGPTP